MSDSPTLPFEPGSRKRRVWTVGEIVESVGKSLEAEHPAVWIRGEVSGFREVRRHWYFDLKDDKAVLPIVMFGGDNAGVPFQPEEGLEVTACGRLTIYPPRGKFQLIANLLEPVGWGALQLAFEQLRGRLEAEGLFAADRKRPVPQLPRCIGVATSATGAAWRDMLRVWSRRDTRLHVLLAPCRVQGDGAAEEIAAAIRLLGEREDVEVVIVGRGGGSREDLWAFNEEAVARAIAEAEVPVIAAVGHEIDTTIADLVADSRAATPTEAAEIVARARGELLDRVRTARRRAESGLRRRVDSRRSRLEHRSLHRALESPARAIRVHEQRLDEAMNRLQGAAGSTLLEGRERLERSRSVLLRKGPATLIARRREEFRRATERARSGLVERIHAARERHAALAAQVDALSPLRVLGRGYALCRDADGRVITEAEEIERGDSLRVRLHRGELGCRVEEIDPKAGSGA